MELPTEIWKEIVSYNVKETIHDKIQNETDTYKLIEYRSIIFNRINNLVFNKKSSLHKYDIIKINNLCCKCSYFAIIMSKEKRDTKDYTIKIINLIKSHINTKYGYFEPKYISVNWFDAEISLTQNDVKVIQTKNDIIEHNRKIANTLKVNDIIEYTPFLFIPTRTNKMYYGRVLSRYRTTIKIEFIDDMNYCFDGKKQIDTKQVLRKLEFNKLYDDGLVEFYNLIINRFKKELIDELKLNLNTPPSIIKNSFVKQSIRLAHKRKLNKCLSHLVFYDD